MILTQKTSLKKKIIISAMILSASIAFIIASILLFLYNKSNKKEDHYKKSLFTINCLYKITNISSPTLILSKVFNKESKINILINNEKCDFLREYNFQILKIIISAFYFMKKKMN